MNNEPTDFNRGHSYPTGHRGYPLHHWYDATARYTGIKFVEDPPESVAYQELATEGGGCLTLKYLNTVSPGLQLAAITQYDYAIQYLGKPTQAAIALDKVLWGDGPRTVILTGRKGRW